MKKSIFFSLVIVLLSCCQVSAQKVLGYYQDFESNTNYTKQGAADTVNTHYVSASHSMRLMPDILGNVYVILPLIQKDGKDFARLGFKHIAKINSDDITDTSKTPKKGGHIQIKNEQGEWVPLESYDSKWGGGSEVAKGLGYFSVSSYSEDYPKGWSIRTNDIPPNNCWKQEYYNIDMTDRNNIELRFVLPKHEKVTDHDQYYGWLIDDIEIYLSDKELAPPEITMLNYPAPINYPGNQAISVSAKIYDINALFQDSLYLGYKYGGQDWEKVPLIASSTLRDVYNAEIPFKGYDSEILWRIVACDTTVNRNKGTFPLLDSLMHLKYVRSINNNESLTTGNDTVADHPFRNISLAARSQYIYTAETLKKHGYKAGNIDELFFNFQKNIYPKGKIDQFTIKMAAATLLSEATKEFFQGSQLETVFEGAITIPEVSAENPWGSVGKFNKKVFRWNGIDDIVVQFCYTNSTESRKNLMDSKRSPLTVAAISIDQGMYSLVQEDLNGTNGCALKGGSVLTLRPDFKFYMVENPPLKYDIGFTDFVNLPKVINATSDTLAITITVKNFGDSVLKSAKIYYQIDENNPLIYNWSGSLEKEQTVNVKIVPGQLFTEGYKVIKVWIDSMSINGSKDDYEPLNNKLEGKFVSCNGPISGANKTIKKNGGTYPSIQGAIEVMRYCGIGGPVAFTISGTDDDQNLIDWNEQLTFYNIPGVSSTNTITFKSDGNRNAPVVIRYTLTEEILQNNLVNLDSAKYVTFENIDFQLDAALSTSNLIKATERTSNITFRGCFMQGNLIGLPCNSIITAEGASNIKIVNTSIKGGKTGILFQGNTSTDMSLNNVIDSSNFIGQTEGVIKLSLQKNFRLSGNNIEFEGNESHNAVFVSLSEKLNITKNRIYSAKGASCLKVSNATTSDSIFVANNMFSKFGAGLEMVRFQDIRNLQFNFNTLRLNSLDELSSTLTLLLINGNSNIYNNIIYSEGLGSAINYESTGTTTKLNNNSYYTAVNNNFGSYNKQSINTFQDWKTKTEQDNNSLFVPLKFASQKADLRTYDKALFEKGVAISSILDDIYGNPRQAQPYIGAFEADSLSKNISLEDLQNPLSSCYLTTAEKVIVTLKNIGLDTIKANDITMRYQFGTTPVVNQIHTSNLIPDSSFTFIFDTPINLSVANSSSHNDSVFELKVWASLLGDPDHTNDTINKKIDSKYQLPAPNVTPIQFPGIEGQPTTMALTWDHLNPLYWFTDSLSNDPIWKGKSYTTPPIYTRNTEYYVSQKTERKIVKITEIQIDKEKFGATTPEPTWLYLNSAIEISNLGNVDVNLLGYKLEIIDATQSIKQFSIPSFLLKQNSSVVIQIGAGTNNEHTIYTGVQAGSALPVPFVAGQGNTVALYDSNATNLIDVVILNNGKLKLGWPALPESIWNGGGVDVPASSPGIRRTVYTPNQASSWVLGSLLQPLTLGSIESSLIQIKENGCYGYKTPIKIVVSGPMSVNLEMSKVSIPATAPECKKGMQPVTVVITNVSDESVEVTDTITVGYLVEGSTQPVVTEIITGGILAKETKTHVFSTDADLRALNRDEQFVIKAFVNYKKDTHNIKDTAYSAPINSYVEPKSYNDTIITGITYGADYTVNIPFHIGNALVWYKQADTTAIDTVYNLPIGRIYEDTSFLIKPLSTYLDPVIMGKGSVISDTNATQTQAGAAYWTRDSKFSRQQFLVLATDLLHAGYSKGTINSLAFNVAEVLPSAPKYILDTFKISIAPTILTQLGNGPFITSSGVVQVYHKINDTIQNTGWHEHLFSTPYIWDGETNLLVDIFVAKPNTSTQRIKMRLDNTPGDRRTLVGQGATPPTTGNSVVERFPYMKFGFEKYRCEGDLSKVELKIDQLSVPESDLALIYILNPKKNNSPDNLDVKVVVKNYSKDTIYQAGLSFYIDGVKQTGATQILGNTDGLQQGESDTIVVMNKAFSSGLYNLKVIIDSISLTASPIFTKVADEFPENDTIVQNSSFCLSGNYTIGGTSPSFTTFSTAIKALKESGICGDVTFDVRNGTYSEQVDISEIYRTPQASKITFKGDQSNTDLVKLQYKAKSADTNYVVRLKDAKYVSFENMTIQALDTNYSRVVEILGNTDGCQISNCVVKGPSIGTDVSNNKALVYLYGNVRGLNIVRNTFENGSIGISATPASVFHEFVATIQNNTFKNFLTTGISFEKASILEIAQNTLISSLASDGIVLKSSDANNLRVIGNTITMIGGGTKPRKGITVSNVSAVAEPTLIANNMISLKGSKSENIGINIDSAASKLNIYFNSVRVESDTTNAKALFVKGSKGTVEVYNNILSNYSKKGGYAYYVQNGIEDVSSTNYNSFYVLPPAINFAYWKGTNISSLLKMASITGSENNSKLIEPFFLTESNLRLKYNNFVDLGTIKASVSVDIDDKERPGADRANPSIGAFEYPVCGTDLSVVKIVSPSLNGIAYDGDSLSIQIEIKNIGNNKLNEPIPIKAYIKGLSDTITYIFNKELYNTAINPEVVTLPKKFIPYGQTGNKEIVVFSMLNGDCYLLNDTITQQFSLIPSFDVVADSVWKTTDSVCNLTAERFTVKIKNAGRVPIKNGDSLKVGAQVKNQTWYSEVAILGTDTIVPGQLYEYTFKNRTWNVYPTSQTDTNVTVRGWANVKYDENKLNDTTASIYRAKSYINPNSPRIVGQIGSRYTANINYATSITLQATQADNLSISWYKSPNLDSPFITGTVNERKNLLLSETYYLQVTNKFGCSSNYDTAQINVATQPATEIACLEITGPTSKVYMETGDYVSVKIKNYGSAAVNNVIVWYKKDTTGSNGKITGPIFGSDTIPSIPAGAEIIHQIKTMLQFDKNIKNFNLYAWVKSIDIAPENDTVKRTFVALIETDYCNPEVRTFDLLDISELRYGYFHKYTPAIGTKEYFEDVVTPNKIFYKGYQDTFFVKCEVPSNNVKLKNLPGYTKIFIDLNRDGTFSTSEEAVFSAKNDASMMVVKIPETATEGYTKMRVISNAEELDPNNINGCSNFNAGGIQDFKIYIRKPYQNNAIIERIESPGSIVDVSTGQNTLSSKELLPKLVKLKLRNLGSQQMNNVSIKWRYNNGEVKTLDWSGSISSMEFEIVNLGNYDFPFGTTNFVAWVDQQDKNVDAQWRIDTIKAQFYRYPVHTTTFEDKFDNTEDNNFYAPVIDKETNRWIREKPSGNVINMPKTNSKAWTLGGYYPAVNQSMLYTAIFNIDMIRPDSMSFYLRKDMKKSAKLYVEYLNRNGIWTLLGTKGDSWYDSVGSFQGENSDYQLCQYSLMKMQDSLGNSTQFRFVFESHNAATTGNGVAIDNFILKRVKANDDVGVVKVENKDIEFGKTVYPTIKISNYGELAQDSVFVYYTIVGANRSYIPIKEVFKIRLMPGDTLSYTFNKGIAIDQNFIGDVSIIAFTSLSQDFYHDNDTARGSGYLQPLISDVGIITLLSPVTKIIAGEKQQVSVQIKNFGVGSIEQLNFYYQVEGQSIVKEQLNNIFINSFGIFEYTFDSTFVASLGSFKMKIWASLPNDAYAPNDTITPRLTGYTGLDDLYADYVTISESADSASVQITVINQGTNGVYQVPVSYYINNDISTVVTELFEIPATIPIDRSASYVFKKKIAKQSQYVVCGFTNLESDNNHKNDTTCMIATASVDGDAIKMLVEENNETNCRVKIYLTNHGNYTIMSPTVTLRDKNTGVILLEEIFTDGFVMPNDTSNFIFTGTIPSKMNQGSNYALLAEVTVVNDFNPNNDTTSIYQTVVKLGIGEEEDEFGEEIMKDFSLSQNMPNPFTDETRIRFTIPESGMVKLMMYDITGHLVFDKKQMYQKGQNSFIINATKFPAGIYLYGIEYKGVRLIKKLTVQK